jgi:DNA-directed RNA polymerase II subunit RPB2
MEEVDKKVWNIIDSYFRDNPRALIDHQIDSYNQFFDEDLKKIIKQNNPIKIYKDYNETTKLFQLKCDIYIGGISGDKIYYGKPIIYDENNIHYMYPNEARLRNMTYGFTVHYDLDIKYTINNKEEIVTYKELYLGKFPIMLQSKYCILRDLPKATRFQAGECKNDLGGYFIIDGKEKVIISQEKFADNIIYTRKAQDDTLIDSYYSHSVEIKSRSEDVSKHVRTTYVRIIAPSPAFSNKQIVVAIPNVRKPIPLFIVMRALGILSDKDIITTCLLDITKYESYIDLFIPSIHDTHNIYTQSSSLSYIKEFIKEKTISKVHDILMNYFLPHVGEMDYKHKARFLGYMVFKLLNIVTNVEKPIDRDNFMYKRIELPGTLLHGLFKEYYILTQKTIYRKIDSNYHFHSYSSNTTLPNNSNNDQPTDSNDSQNYKFTDLISNNISVFKNWNPDDVNVDIGFKKAFKGDWGAAVHNKKVGIVQGLDRLSFNSAISQRRKLNLPLDDSAKVVGPRLLHGSQMYYIDPVDTPDGGNIGTHKYLAILTKITNHVPSSPIIYWLHHNLLIIKLSECLTPYLANNIKIFVNGNWIGMTSKPAKLIQLFKYHRRQGILPIFLSISWFIKEQKIDIFTDSGRLTRPIFYITQETSNSPEESKDNPTKPVIIRESSFTKLTEPTFTWNRLITGCDDLTNLHSYTFTDKLTSNQLAILDYMDVSEEANAYISTDGKNIDITLHTHVELHPSLMLGVMGNQIILPANNQLPRDLFSCSQSKQGVSLYHSNYQVRIDQTGIVLNYGQIPLIKSKYLKYISNEEHPYGENVIVAIGVYGSYNVEDSILFNKGSLDRGMFRTTYFNSYETREESTQVKGGSVDSTFTNIESHENVSNTKVGYDYSHLDDNGIIKENTYLNDKIILIGKTIIDGDNNLLIDDSISTKKGQLGYVDKTYISSENPGFRLSKVKIREERIPAIGDKFCSRCGQKGTIGLVIPEENMPFTAEGLKPDIIINPHAFPSRMTIGQLVETIMGKVSCNIGAFGDTTAFVNKGSKHAILGEMLTQSGLHSSGNHILYNGENGHMMNMSFFVGPTYYMRLKHMVKDKINYRDKGPRTMLTRQTVQGRSNEGGLRIGEMEKDAIVSHGLNYFLNESMLVRGDLYYIAICNKTGMLAIYNESKNIFLSPLADGPMKFTNQVLPHDPGQILNISKYSREFSILKVPYTFKLLLHELLTMNVSLRLITADNIEQISSMTFTHEITDKLQIKKLSEEDNANISDESNSFLSNSLEAIGLTNLTDSMTTNITNQTTSLAKNIQDGVDNTLSDATDITDSITTQSTSLAKNIQDGVDNTLSDATDITDSITTQSTSLAKNIQDGVGNAVSNATDITDSITNQTTSLAKNIQDGIGNAVSNATDITDSITNQSTSLAKNIQDGVGSIRNTMIDVTDQIGKTTNTTLNNSLEALPTSPETLTGLQNIGSVIGDKSSKWMDTVGTSTSEAMKTLGTKSSELIDVTNSAMKTVESKSTELANITNAVMKSIGESSPKISDSIETLLPTESQLKMLTDSAEKKLEEPSTSTTKIIQ